jgi:hypothetical protein
MSNCEWDCVARVIKITEEVAVGEFVAGETGRQSRTVDRLRRPGHQAYGGKESQYNPFCLHREVSLDCPFAFIVLCSDGSRIPRLYRETAFSRLEIKA